MCPLHPHTCHPRGLEKRGRRGVVTPPGSCSNANPLERPPLLLPSLIADTAGGDSMAVLCPASCQLHRQVPSASSSLPTGAQHTRWRQHRPFLNAATGPKALSHSGGRTSVYLHHPTSPSSSAPRVSAWAGPRPWRGLLRTRVLEDRCPRGCRTCQHCETRVVAPTSPHTHSK